MTPPAPIRIWVLALALSALAILPAHSAAPYVETFASGMNGWTNIGTAVWRTNSGTARVSMTAAPGTAIATLTTTGANISAVFTGNYVEAGITLIGFKFMAETTLPDTMDLRLLESLTNGYSRSDLASLVTSTGVWHQFFFSLENRAAGSWGGGTDENFSNVLNSIRRVDIQASRPGFASAVFRVDDIVLDRLPAASALASGSASNMTLTGDFLQTNVTYLIEATPELTGVWTTVQSLLATNRQMTVTLTNAGPQLFWRLAIP